GRPLIVRVIEALREGGADPVLVVIPPTERKETFEICRLACEANAAVTSPDETTADMRATFELGVDWLLNYDAQDLPDAVFLAPGDSPALTADLTRAMIQAFCANTSDFVLPAVSGKRGHPLLMSWSRAILVRQLPSGSGVNMLLFDPSATIHELPVDDPGIILDLDTPDDYRRWTQ